MKNLITIFVMLLFSVQSMAIPVKVKFKILDENGEALKGSTIRIYDNNRLIRMEENAPSKVVWKLESDRYYTIEISLNKYVSKRIAFYTNVDDQVEDILDNRFVFFAELEHQSKYAKRKNADNIVDYPSAIVEFNSAIGVFD